MSSETMTRPTYPADMPDDVKAELEDPEFATRQHYSRSTYALGCHGPLCGLAEAHRARRRLEARAAAAGVNHTVTPRKATRDDELAPFVAWHLDQRKAPKK